MSKSPITCHVLDASLGRPAAGVDVSLELVALTEGVVADTTSRVLAKGQTDNDGRCTTLLSPDAHPQPGVYKMVFHSGPYFEANGQSCFYPIVEITFNYSHPDQHYHIPLLISPFSYTTYRGS
ncbi:hypothetical protein DB88DRAFT_441394 [Papiliotrema laurentii]|uniref:5-hydroxyisourate hydrolase n=1 Tax=Papiliotrema laurentii TaxID=5418 RepID=A0AAD9CUQ5_PAPLA|nr:hypothetical protein DB88DRAFT_441394 [Papiliotrema laurentii]